MRSEKDENDDLKLTIQNLVKAKHDLSNIQDSLNEAMESAPFPVVIDHIHKVLTSWSAAKNEIDVQIRLLRLLQEKTK